MDLSRCIGGCDAVDEVRLQVFYLPLCCSLAPVGEAVSTATCSGLALDGIGLQNPDPLILLYFIFDKVE